MEEKKLYNAVRKIITLAAGVAVVPPSRRCVIWARTRTPART